VRRSAHRGSPIGWRRGGFTDRYPPGAVIDRRGHAIVPVAAPLPWMGLALLAMTLAISLAACGAATPTTAPTNSTPTAAPVSLPPSPAASVAASEPATTEPAPTAAATSVATAPDCAPADIKASHGLVEGAAGSIVTEVVLVSNSACSIDAFPALGLRDANGGALVGGAATGPGRIDLVAGTAYTSQVRLANWCVPDPEFPLALEIIVNGAPVAVTGDSFPEAGGLPPCNGDGTPILEGTAWAPTS
jgi:hypothetical protein